MSTVAPSRASRSAAARPIPEALARYADADDLIAHDCALHGNPSHSGIDDLEREYPPALLDRCILYHYASAADGEALRARGRRIAHPGECIELAEPTAPRTASSVTPDAAHAASVPA